MEPTRIKREVTELVSTMCEATETPKQDSIITRRQFLRTSATISLTAAAGCSWHHATRVGDQANGTQPINMRLGASDLVVQPVLMYEIAHRREARSWRNWGAVHTEEAVKSEGARIGRDLNELCRSADFAVQALPLVRVANSEQASGLRDVEADVLLVYAAGGWTDTLNALAGLGKPIIIFVRKHSRPYYLWDEIVHARFLRMHTDNFAQPSVDVNDVVVDDNEEIVWRLRALAGLKNTLGRRIVCIGGRAAGLAQRPRNWPANVSNSTW